MFKLRWLNLRKLVKLTSLKKTKTQIINKENIIKFVDWLKYRTLECAGI